MNTAVKTNHLFIMKLCVLIIIISAISLAGCSVQPFKPRLTSSDKLFHSQFEQLLPEVKETEAHYGETNQLLGYFDLCAINQYARKHEDSNHYCQQAEALAENLKTQSISENIHGMIAGSSVVKYSGKSYERNMLYALGMINYAALHNPAEALVESRRLDIAANGNQTKMISQEESLGRYLSALLYESEGSMDSALIDYRKAFYGYLHNHQSLGLPFPSAIGNDLLRAFSAMELQNEYHFYKKKHFLTEGESPLAGNNGEVVLIFQVGYAPYQITEYFSDAGDVVPVSVYKMRPPLVRKVVAQRLDNREKFTSLKIYDAALTIKHNEIPAINQQIEESELVLLPNSEFEAYGGEHDDIHPVTSQTRADVRSWSTLPNNILLLRMSLPEGEHSLKLNYVSFYGETVYRQTLNNVHIKAGKRTFLYEKLP